MKPHILVSAFSFAPRQGSESGTGWATVLPLAEEYDITVVCVAHYRGIFFTDEDLLDLRAKGVEVVFFEDDPHAWLLKFPYLTAHKIYYMFWQKAVRPVFEKIIAEKNPVALFHATWSLGRVPTALVGHGIPVIFGPVGGFESGCLRLSKSLGFKTHLKELLRCFSIWQSSHSKPLRKMYPEIELTLTYTRESINFIRGLGARKIAQMSNAGIYEKNVLALQDLRSRRQVDGIFRMLFVGRLVGWKGEELAIRAAAALKDGEWELTLLGSGENAPRCRKIAARLGVADKVHFQESVPQEQVWDYYARSDVFVFPSLHDSGGNAVLEAMGAGLPVVCLDLGGPGEYVTRECGEVVAAGPLPQVVAGLASALNTLQADPELTKRKGAAAARRCLDELTWEARSVQLLDFTRQVVHGTLTQTDP